METILKHVSLAEISIGDTNKMFRDDSEMQTGALHDLIASIKEKGVIQPVLLRPKGNKYELVCGERRYRASKAADLKDIPAYIRPLTDEEALESQIIENLQRENPNPMKEAIAFDWMVKTKKLSTKQISDRIGKSIDYVQERIRLTTLTKEGQEYVRSGVLPLKAALKLASVPENMQNKALSDCIDTVEGVKGKTNTFKGLERLQRWLEQNIFSELALADFNINDAQLVPAAGSCQGCTKRTRNAGGLFDDVAKKDMCLDGGCFVAKQFAHYKQVHEEARLNFVGAKVVFKSRSWDLPAALKQKLSKLGEIITGYNSPGTEITKSEAEKGLELENGADPSKILITVMVGNSMYKSDMKKRYICYTTAKPKSKTSSGSTGTRSKADLEKEKASVAIQKKANELEELLTSQAAVKKFKTAKLSEKILQGLISQLLEETCNDDKIVPALMSLGIKFSMHKFGSKETILFNGKDPIQYDENFGLSKVEEIIETVTGDKLNALAAVTLSTCFYGIKQDKFFKSHKIDLKAIAAKAKAEATKWYKDQQAKKVTVVKEPAKPGLKKLLPKKSQLKK